MWEYKRKNYNFRLHSDIVEALNIEGKENWEVIFYQEEKRKEYDYETTAKVLFKRLLIEPICQQQEQQ